MLVEKMTVEEILCATGGTLVEGNKKGQITDITTDSRKAEEGMLFIPLQGPTFDGHEFIRAAFDCGAAAVLTQKDIEPLVGKTIIRVTDTMQALADIARFYKAKLSIPCVGITGSVGKTTTKDMVASVLEKKYRTLKTHGNFNNEIGLPLTVFRLNRKHEMAVLEMGMSGFGEIHRLTSIAKPDVAVITNIGMSHIEKLGSQEGILKAKLEITDFFDSQSTLILNGDDPFLSRVRGEKAYHVMTYGIKDTSCDVTAKDIENLGAEGLRFTVVIGKEEYPAYVKVAGEHNVYNALATVCVGQQYHIPMEDILSGIEEFELTKMRMDIKDLGAITLINDCYNASPDSMKASLKVLSDMEGHKIAILGDILEMGEFAEPAHYEIGEEAAKLGIDVLITVGHNAKQIAAGAEKEGMLDIRSFERTRDCLSYIRETLQAGDTVLVKASRGMRFEMICETVEEKANEQ
jgi:UDP-N-acetylmuramoyl-tripeptide--D-alanyl-D-alanine ligase